MSRDTWEPDIRGRFWEKVAKSSGCWEWQGALNSKGYGYFTISYGGKQHNIGAHRVAYSLTYGHPGKFHVCHHCDNPTCVKPDHLYAGTASQNMKDMVDRKRHPGHTKTHCKYGHSDWKVSTNGRYCAECNRIKCRKRSSKLG